MTAPSSPGTPSMEKRVLQAVLLSLAVLLVYQSFFAPRRQPQQQAAHAGSIRQHRLPLRPPGPASCAGCCEHHAQQPRRPALPASLRRRGRRPHRGRVRRGPRRVLHPRCRPSELDAEAVPRCARARARSAAGRHQRERAARVLADDQRRDRLEHACQRQLHAQRPDARSARHRRQDAAVRLRGRLRPACHQAVHVRTRRAGVPGRLLGPGASQRAAAELHHPLGSGHRRHRTRPAFGRHDVRQLLPGARRHHVYRRDPPYRHRQAGRAARLRRRRSATRASTTTTSSARHSSTGSRTSSTRRTRCRPPPVRARSCRTP